MCAHCEESSHLRPAINCKTLTSFLSLFWPAGSSVAFSPGNLSTSSSASSTLGSPENEEYILSFETIDKMRRVSSYSALNSLIGESSLCPPGCKSSLAKGLLYPKQHTPSFAQNTSQNSLYWMRKNRN